MYVLDKRNTLWLRDTVRQTFPREVSGRGRPAVGPAAADFPRDVCLTVSRNHKVFLLYQVRSLIKETCYDANVVVLVINTDAWRRPRARRCQAISRQTCILRSSALLVKLLSVEWHRTFWWCQSANKPLPEPILTGIYRKTSSISRTKSQNPNVSCILLQLSSLNPLKPGVKLRMKM